MVVKLRFPATESFVCRQLANVADVVMRAYEESSAWCVDRGAGALKFLGRCLLFAPGRIPVIEDWRIPAAGPWAARRGVRSRSLAPGNPKGVAGEKTGSAHRPEQPMARRR